MKKTHNTNTKYNTYIYIIFLFLAITTFLWFLLFNRYHIIGFHEEMQLFRTDYLYFESFLTRPGGLIDYLGSFFTQFFYYHWLGALILSLCLSIIFILYTKICKTRNNTIERFIVFPFIVPVLFLMVCGDMHFHLTYILTICFTFICTTIYLLIPEGKKRYIAGPLLYLLVYFVTAGSAILFTTILIINELFNKKRSYLYIIGLIVISALIPYLAHQFIYIALLKNTYFAFTPFILGFPHKTYITAWLAIPTIYIVAEYINKKNWLHNTRPIKVLIPTYILVSLMLFYGIKTVYEPDLEYIAEMEHRVVEGNWDEVLNITSTYKPEFRNNICTYYTNIALSELGLLSSKMFHYQQIGTAGLFINWAPVYFTPWRNGELYYWIGIIPEAEHCAYESMVNSPIEYGSKPLKRLVYTTMLRKDSAGFEKYIKMFEKSPIYSKWAKEQREYYSKTLIDSTFHIPGTPKAINNKDFFINYNIPEYNLEIALQTNKSNKKLFEYLMAALLLRKDLDATVSVIEQYYANMTYDKMPRHYEEALLICTSIMNDKRDILSKYIISEETVKDFREYIKMSERATYQQAIDNLEKRYGNTYWFYFQHVNPVLLEQSNINNRY